MSELDLKDLQWVMSITKGSYTVSISLTHIPSGESVWVSGPANESYNLRNAALQDLKKKLDNLDAPVV